MTDGTCLKWIGKFDAGGFSGAVAARVGGEPSRAYMN